MGQSLGTIFLNYFFNYATLIPPFSITIDLAEEKIIITFTSIAVAIEKVLVGDNFLRLFACQFMVITEFTRLMIRLNAFF